MNRRKLLAALTVLVLLLSTGSFAFAKDNLPVITITGNASVTVEAGSNYVDDGATAVDSKGKDITSHIITTGDIIDTSKTGIYTVTYEVTDKDKKVQETRTVTVVDTTLPVITLLGDAAVTVEAGTGYTDAGVTAADSLDGDITDKVVTVNPVVPSTPGIYTVTYDVKDAAGNSAAQVTRTVTVKDTTPPVITLLGDAAVTVEAGTGYTDAGVTAADSLDGDITDKVVTVNPVVPSTPGIYTVTYDVKDAAGNAAAQVTRTVTVKDTTPPVITLLGDAAVTVEAGTGYTDAGVTAADSLDGDITDKVVTVNPVVPSTPGIYTVTYDVKDAAGNSAAQVTRTVTVKDTTPPVITLLGDAAVTVEAGTGYTDAGVTAADSLDGDITDKVVTVNPVVPSTPGIYTVTYDVKDAAGNSAAQVTRTVTVKDTTPPVITLLGDAAVTVEAGTGYTDAGVTAADNLDGDITDKVVTVNPVVPSAPGIYTVTYDVKDAAGNAAAQVTRTVTVKDTTPVITLLGDAAVTVEAGNGYTDAGATANDGFHGDLTASIVTINPVDPALPGIYSVTYNVTDPSDNKAAEVTRTVTVLEKTTLANYVFSGFLKPINNDGTSDFKTGSTIPVKFALKDSNGNFVTDAVATLSYEKIGDNINDRVKHNKAQFYFQYFRSLINDYISGRVHETGNLFRYDSRANQYIFNLKTKDLTPGIYKLTVTLDDGMSYDVQISLKK